MGSLIFEWSIPACQRNPEAAINDIPKLPDGRIALLNCPVNEGSRFAINSPTLPPRTSAVWFDAITDKHEIVARVLRYPEVGNIIITSNLMSLAGLIDKGFTSGKAAAGGGQCE